MQDRPFKIGVALGGGAFRGLAHIGVLQMLEQAGIVHQHGRARGRRLRLRHEP